jgi:hypothetical protein
MSRHVDIRSAHGGFQVGFRLPTEPYVSQVTPTGNISEATKTGHRYWVMVPAVFSTIADMIGEISRYWKCPPSELDGMADEYTHADLLGLPEGHQEL